MTHKDTGKYAAKHRPGLETNQKLAEAIKRKVVDGELTCGNASRITGSMKLDMKAVGVALDLLEIRIAKCQLGLFGHGENDKPIKAAKIIKTDMVEAIREALVNQRLPCKAAWDIAARFGVPKMRIASLCEALNIKIKPCQLGAF